MQTLSYKALTSRIRSGSSEKRIPMYGIIEVTRRCPLSCAHCYNNLPLQDNEARLNELSLSEHFRIIDEISAAGCLWLTYTGGEIFARKDFLDIYTYAKKKGFIVSLFTNGTLITTGIADYLAALRPYSIEITVYGVTKETHESVTGIPGSFEDCMKAIRLLMDRKLPLNLKTMALTLNEHELWQIKSFVEDELGLQFRFDPLINPRIDYSQAPLSLRLSPRRAVELEMLDPQRKSGWRTYAENRISRHRSHGTVYYCSAGDTGFGIDPYGGLNICFFSPGGKFDLRKGSFREGWEGRLLQERSRKIMKHTKCIDCTIREMCGMCPPNGELEKGDPEEPVDFFCEVAHLRAKNVGIVVQPHGVCAFCEGGKLEESLY